MTERADGGERAEPKRRPPPKTRRRYVNTEYPTVVLRFEDGHEIRIRKGRGKSFEGYQGERIKVIAIYDPSSDERVVVATLKAEEFEEAP